MNGPVRARSGMKTSGSGRLIPEVRQTWPSDRRLRGRAHKVFVAPWFGTPKPPPCFHYAATPPELGGVEELGGFVEL